MNEYYFSTNNKYKFIETQKAIDFLVDYIDRFNNDNNVTNIQNIINYIFDNFHMYNLKTSGNITDNVGLRDLENIFEYFIHSVPEIDLKIKGLRVSNPEELRREILSSNHFGITIIIFPIKNLLNICMIQTKTKESENILFEIENIERIMLDKIIYVFDSFNITPKSDFNRQNGPIFWTGPLINLKKEYITILNSIHNTQINEKNFVLDEECFSIFKYTKNEPSIRPNTLRMDDEVNFLFKTNTILGSNRLNTINIVKLLNDILPDFIQERNPILKILKDIVIDRDFVIDFINSKEESFFLDHVISKTINL